MRIALVTHNVIRSDGQGRVNLELAARALARGHSVTLIADRVDPSILQAGAAWARVPVLVEKPHLVKVAEFAARASHVVRRLRSQLDVVHANGFSLDVDHEVSTSHFVHAAWARSTARATDAAGPLQAAYQALYAGANARWERRAYARARAVIGVSELVRAELRDAGVAPEKIDVIPNGVDVEEFVPGDVDRAELGLPRGVPLALFAGALRTGRKNLDTVLRAMERLPELHLAVVGDATGSPFPELAERLGVSGRVVFLGFRSDVARIMRAVDLFVFPSRYEPFALVVLEAMASGVPVVTARSVGASFLAARAGCPVLDDPDDVSGLASEIRRLIADPRLRADLGRRAREVAETCTWNAMATRYLAVYERARR
jgi:glycosyltransferase involved in cell wall biosynthesis